MPETAPAGDGSGTGPAGRPSRGRMARAVRGRQPTGTGAASGTRWCGRGGVPSHSRRCGDGECAHPLRTRGVLRRPARGAIGREPGGAGGAPAPGAVPAATAAAGGAGHGDAAGPGRGTSPPGRDGRTPRIALGRAPVFARVPMAGRRRARREVRAPDPDRSRLASGIGPRMPTPEPCAWAHVPKTAPGPVPTTLSPAPIGSGRAEATQPAPIRIAERRGGGRPAMPPKGRGAGPCTMDPCRRRTARPWPPDAGEGPDAGPVEPRWPWWDAPRTGRGNARPADGPRAWPERCSCGRMDAGPGPIPPARGPTRTGRRCAGGVDGAWPKGGAATGIDAAWRRESARWRSSRPWTVERGGHG